MSTLRLRPNPRTDSLLRVAVTLCSVALLQVVATEAVAAQTGSITGKVTESRSGLPVFAATANALSGARIVASTRTGEDGTYRLTGLPAGTYTVVVQRIGFVPGRKENVTVSEGGTATADVQISETVFQLERTVVSTSRSTPEQATRAPQSVSVVDVREITERPSVTVSDHLQGLQGVDINKGGIAQSNVVARGFNNAFSGSVLMLQDYRFAGVPSLRVNVPLLFTASNEDIESVEVLLGPSSALYGPNSSHGVVHVLTKSPFTSQGTTVTIDGGERSLLRGSIRHAALLSPKFGYKISGEYFTATDWKSRSGFNAANGPSDTLPQWDPGEPDVFPQAAPAGRAGRENIRDFDIERTVGELRVDYRPAEGNEYVTTLGLSRIGKGMEYTGANGTALAKNWTYMSIQQRMRLGRFFAQAFANFSDAGNKDSLDLSGTYLLRSGQPIVDKSRVYAAQVQHGFRPAEWEDLIYGIDYISTNPRTGGTINGRNEDIDDVREIGGYLQSTTQLGPKWEFIGTLRVDNNDQVEGSQFSPRAGILFKPTATQNFRATFNRAFGTPANFTWFLDLIQLRNVGGTPYNIRALGNPPKTGWTFNRTCNAQLNDGLCMRTIFTGTQGETVWQPATAAVAYRGVIAGNATALTQGIAATLQAAPLGFPAAQAAQIAGDIVRAMGTIQPTPAQVGTALRFLGSTTNLTPQDVADIGPIKASYNNTYELGYKGIIGSRLRIAIDAWSEKRGDVGNPAGLSTPNVFFDPTSLRSYLAGALPDSIRIALQTRLGMSQQQATAVAAQLAPGIANTVSTNFAPLPLGIVSFNSPTFASARDIYATYTSYSKSIRVNGVDFAADLLDLYNWSFGATYSWVSDLVFPEVTSSNSTPLMLNAPDNKASLTARYRNAAQAWGIETRVRYINGYPVNSGVYATDFTFPRPGSTTTYRYYPVRTATLVDLNVNKRFRAARDFFIALNAENLLNNGYRTMPGAPLIGRLVSTRLQYSF